VWLHVPSCACGCCGERHQAHGVNMWGGRPRGDSRMQVVAFADALRGPGGAPLLRAAHVATTSPPPREAPDLVAVTPAGLITATQNYGPFFGWEWTRAGVVARCGSSAQLLQGVESMSRVTARPTLCAQPARCLLPATAPVRSGCAAVAVGSASCPHSVSRPS
jgi:hypothetical protein